MAKLVPFSEEIFEQYCLARQLRGLRPPLRGSQVGVWLVDDEGEFLSGCLLFIGNTFAYVEDFAGHPDIDPLDAVVAMSLTLKYLRVFGAMSGLVLRVTAESEAVESALRREGWHEQVSPETKRAATPFALFPGEVHEVPDAKALKGSKKEKGRRKSKKGAPSAGE